MRGEQPREVQRNGGWWRFDDLIRAGAYSSDRRRVNTLVKLGLVERRSVASSKTGHYAIFRPTTSDSHATA